MLWLAFKTVINLQANTQGSSFMCLLCKCLFKDFLCGGRTGAAQQQTKTYYSWEAATLPRYRSERVYSCFSLWGLCIKAFLSKGHTYVVLFQLIIKSKNLPANLCMIMQVLCLQILSMGKWNWSEGHGHPKFSLQPKDASLSSTT